MSDNTTEILKDARAALVSAAEDLQAIVLREAGFEDFVYSNDEVGKACKSCWRSYTQCCKRLKAGKSTCCDQCTYTATHDQHSLDSVMSAMAFNALAATLTDAVKAIDAQIREFSPVGRAEKALDKFDALVAQRAGTYRAEITEVAEALRNLLKEQKA